MADLKNEDDVCVYLLRDGKEYVIIIGDCSGDAGAVIHHVSRLSASSHETCITCTVIVGQAVGV